MTKIFANGILLALLPTCALAHIGHIADAAGHDHWVAGAAIGIAIAVGIAKVVKDKNSKANEPEEDAEPDDTEGEPA